MTMQPEIYLQSTRDYWNTLHCRSVSQAVREFYNLWRAADGSIPWEIVIGDETLTEADVATLVHTGVANVYAADGRKIAA